MEPEILKFKLSNNPTLWHFSKSGKPIMYHVGISGGKDSDAVLLWVQHESGIPSEQIDVTFCNTGNEDKKTYAHVKMLSKKIRLITWLKPALFFFALARKKKRFPSTKARFCTQDLKMKPTALRIRFWEEQGYEVISISGVRAEESIDRAKLPEWSPPLDSYFLVWEWRPLLKWKIEQVWLIHHRYNIPRNSLYDEGAVRVGCFPCINSRKREVRLMARTRPERIVKIRQEEQGFEERSGRYSSFFARNTVPLVMRSKEITTKAGEVMKVATIDDVVRWSNTTHGGKVYLKSYKDQSQIHLIEDLDDDVVLTSDDAGICSSQYGACE